MRKLGNTLQDSGPIPRYAGRQEVLFPGCVSRSQEALQLGNPVFYKMIPESWRDVFNPLQRAESPVCGYKLQGY